MFRFGIVYDGPNEGGCAVLGVVARGKEDGVPEHGEVRGVLILPHQDLMLDLGKVHPVDG